MIAREVKVKVKAKEGMLEINLIPIPTTQGQPEIVGIEMRFT